MLSSPRRKPYPQHQAYRRLWMNRSCDILSKILTVNPRLPEQLHRRICISSRALAPRMDRMLSSRELGSTASRKWNRGGKLPERQVFREVIFLDVSSAAM